MARRLYLELLDAYHKKGYAIKKREELHNINFLTGLAERAPASK